MTIQSLRETLTKEKADAIAVVHRIEGALSALDILEKPDEIPADKENKNGSN